MFSLQTRYQKEAANRIQREEGRVGKRGETRTTAGIDFVGEAPPRLRYPSPPRAADEYLSQTSTPRASDTPERGGSPFHPHLVHHHDFGWATTPSPSAVWGTSISPRRRLGDCTAYADQFEMFHSVIGDRVASPFRQTRPSTRLVTPAERVRQRLNAPR